MKLLSFDHKYILSRAPYIIVLLGPVLFTVIGMTLLNLLPNVVYRVPQPLGFIILFFILFLLIPLGVVSLASGVYLLMQKKKISSSLRVLLFTLLSFSLLAFAFVVTNFIQKNHFDQLGNFIVQKLEYYHSQHGTYPPDLLPVTDNLNPKEYSVILQQFTYSPPADSRESFTLSYTFPFQSWLKGCRYVPDENSGSWDCYPD